VFTRCARSHPSLRTIAATLAHTLPDAGFVELAGSGHVTYAERPDEFAAAVAAFATEVGGRDRVGLPSAGTGHQVALDIARTITRSTGEACGPRCLTFQGATSSYCSRPNSIQRTDLQDFVPGSADHAAARSSESRTARN
jgi:hypothetical protein